MSGDGGDGDAWSRRFLERLAALGVRASARGGGRRSAAGPGSAVSELAGSQELTGSELMVSELAVSAGSVGARVTAPDGRVGHDVWVELAAFEARQWARAEQALAADPEARAALLDGELPVRVEGVLARAGLSLLPARAEDLTLECSCPAWSGCDHLAAVLSALAAAFDADPFLLLLWRGRTKDRLLRHLENLHPIADGPGPDGPPPEEDVRPLAERLADFWSEGGRHRALMAAAGPPTRAEAAPAELSEPGVLIRGRSLESLLQPAYEALMDDQD